jgi:hypothetical protein
MRSRLNEQMLALDSRIEALEKLPARESGWDFKETGVLFKDAWNTGTQEQRRELLLRAGITYRTKRTPGTKMIHGEIYIPDEILDRLNEKKPLPNQG